MSKQRTRNGVLERQCRTCEDWFGLDKLVKHPRCSGGVRPICILCNRMARRNYYKPRPNRVRAPLTAEQKARHAANQRARYARLRERGVMGRDVKKSWPREEQQRKAG